MQGANEQRGTENASMQREVEVYSIDEALLISNLDALGGRIRSQVGLISFERFSADEFS